MFSCCNILHFRLQMYNKYLEYTRILAEKVNLFVFLGSRCIAAHLPPMVTLRPRGTAANGRISIDLEIAQYALEALNIDTFGLDQIDNKLLTTIIDKFRGGPVGLNTIATAMGEDAGTIEDVYEPYLIKEGFIKRTPRGREATELAYKHLGKTPISADGQQSIF